MVRKFMEYCGQLTNGRPTMSDSYTRILRERLIIEEAVELVNAIENADIIATADGIADLLYILLGTAVTFGIDIEPIFKEVHRSNMSKIGGKIDRYGKLIKPPGYSPPDIELILNQQKSRKNAGDSI